MTGRGKASFKDGHLYDGDIKNGMLNGKGVFTWTDGTVFKGKFKNNEITGEGRYDWPDGTYYSGHLKVGIRNGTGKYVNPNEYIYLYIYYIEVSNMMENGGMVSDMGKGNSHIIMGHYTRANGWKGVNVAMENLHIKQEIHMKASGSIMPDMAMV